MTRIGQSGWVAVAVATMALLCGCQSVTSRDKDHPSSSFLDSGPQPRVSRRQAADVQFSMGHSLEEQGQLDEARASYVAAIQKDPSRADAELRLAILDDRKGDQTGADRHFSRALKLQPKNPEILCDQGYSLYLRCRWGDAEVALKQALAIDPGHARSHTNLALVMARRGDKPGALTEFARAGCDPSDARANLALVLAMEGRFDEAQREYAVALVAKPGSSHAKEGLHAATVALSGRLEPRSIAASNGKPATPPVDPALQRTSAPSGR